MSEVPNLVLGQPTFESGARNFPDGTAGSVGLSEPSQVASDGTMIAVADTGNHRVLLWRTWPTRSGQPADVVIGQNDFASALPSWIWNRQRGMHSPRGVAFLGGRLVVSDTENHRLLVYWVPPTSSVAAPDIVLGQADVFATLANRNRSQPGADTLNRPWFLSSSSAAALAVADRGNNRVLAWRTFPASAATPPNVVLGQPGFTTKDFRRDASGLVEPLHAVFSDRTHSTYVVDRGKRLVGYAGAFPSSGALASGAVGQPNLTSYNTNQGDEPAAHTLSAPASLLPV